MFIFFDVDSTLVTIEGCDQLAYHKGVGDEVSAITQATMNGEMDFDAAFPGKVAAVAPSCADMGRLSRCYRDHITPGVIDVVSKLQSDGHQIGIISHGYHDAMTGLIEYLSINTAMVHALSIGYDDQGAFDHLVRDNMIAGAGGKANILRSYKKNYPDETIAFVGDSLGDYQAGQYADLFIPFGGVVVRPAVEAIAESIAMTMDDVLLRLRARQRATTIPLEESPA